MVRALRVGLLSVAFRFAEGYRKVEEELGEDTGDELEGPGANGQRREVMTRLVTALNWEMVARTVGASLPFSFLSR